MFRMAQFHYKKAADVLKHIQCVLKQEDFMLLYDQASCYVNLKEYSLAEEKCKEAIKFCKSKSVYKLLAACLVQQNKIGEAIEVFHLALRFVNGCLTELISSSNIISLKLDRMFPKSSQLYTSFGKLCARMSFEEDAYRILTTAINLDGSNVEALNELAVLYQVFFSKFQVI